MQMPAMRVILDSRLALCVFGSSTDIFSNGMTDKRCLVDSRFVSQHFFCYNPHRSFHRLPSVERFPISDNTIKMNQTICKNLYDNGGESSALQSPSISFKPKLSGSFKASDKRQKTEHSSIETLEEYEGNLNGSFTNDFASFFIQKAMLPNEKENLICMVKMLRRRLEEVEITIESGKVSESYDRVTESKVVIEQLREMLQTSLTHQSTSASVHSVSKKVDRRSTFSDRIGFRKLGSLMGFRNKNDDKTVVSTCDDDSMLDPTEDNTSVGSEDVLDFEQAAFAEQPSVVFFIDNLNCTSDQLHNRRLLKMDLILYSPKNKK
jgi:hypothetical protein